MTGKLAQEALARFDDGTSPLRVLEVATALDRRVELELALLDEAVDAARELPPGRIVHLNASPLTALSPELPDVIDRADRGVVLEMTENGQSRRRTQRNSAPRFRPAVLIAEGVERQEEAASLLSLGVPVGQRYHLGRPTLLATTSASTPVADIESNLVG